MINIGHLIDPHILVKSKLLSLGNGLQETSVNLHDFDVDLLVGLCPNSEN